MHVTISMSEGTKKWATAYAAKGGLNLSSLIELLLYLLRKDRIRVQLVLDAAAQQHEQETWEEEETLDEYEERQRRSEITL